MKTLTTDVLVIGSGIAGLMTALSISGDKSVILVTKGRLRASNSFYAQGGVAVALDTGDDILFHKEDTLKTGHALCDERAVQILVEEGPDRIRDLMKFGVKFDKTKEHEFEFLKEGAHSRRRVLHVADKTGFSIENVLARQVKNRPNLHVYETCYLDELLVENQTCFGVLVTDLKQKQAFRIFAGATVLATGGAGTVFEKHTNWFGSTGDGLACAYIAGATVRDMAFYQFHPTAIQLQKRKKGLKNFLISESVRGEGAIIVNQKGDRFLFDDDERGELAPRDIVSRSIYRQLEMGNTVFLDLTKIQGSIPERFPVIYRNCLKDGVDIAKTSIPIIPVAHFMIGGIETDIYGQTNILRLYACGEVASTGVHGANRLASNSLLECIVYGYRVACHINQQDFIARSISARKPLSEKSTLLTAKQLKKIVSTAQKLMYQCAGIVRSEEPMRTGLQNIHAWLDILEGSKTSSQTWKETYHQLVISRLILESALNRHESRGVHYRLDYPKTDPLLNYHHTISAK